MAELQPLVSEMFLGSWVDVTSLIERDNGNGIRISRKPLTWGEKVAPTTANWTFKNEDNDLYGRNPNSQYYGLLGRNTEVRHRLMPVQALFDQVTVDSWPNTSTGNLPWTNSGGAAGDYDSNGVVGTQTLTSADVFRTSFITPVRTPLDVTVRVLVSQVATGASITSWAAIGTDLNNCYFARIAWNTDNTARLDLRKNVAGVETNLHPDGDPGETIGTYDIGVSYYIRLQWHLGGFLRCMAWLSSATPPSAWTIATRTRDTSIAFASITKAGLFSRRETGNTNVNPVAQFDNFEINEYRFWGEIPSFSPVRDTTGRQKSVPVTAAGLSQRLSAGQGEIRSPMTAAMLGNNDADIRPVAHWSMEDPAGSTRFASSFADQPAIAIAGEVTLGGYSGFAGSKPLPTLGTDANVTAVFPTGNGNTGFYQIQHAFMIPTNWNVNADLIRIDVSTSGGAVYSRIIIRWLGLSTPSTPLTLTVYNTAGTLLGSSAMSFLANNTGVGVPLVMAVTDSNDGVHQIRLGLYDIEDGLLQSQVSVTDADPIGSAVALPLQLRASASAVHSGWCIGQLALFNDDTALTVSNIGSNARAGSGYDGELAGTRMLRMSVQEDIPFTLIGDEDDTAACGPQPIARPIEVFVDAANVDQGVLQDARAGFGLEYIPRVELENTTTSATFSADNTHDMESLQIIDDDRSVRNKITTRRSSTGSFAIAEITEGGTSTAEPPDGIGTYAEDLPWNVATDEQLSPLAGWRALVLGWDEARYPGTAIWRQRDAIADVPALDSALLSMDVISRYVITDPPVDLPPDDIGLLVQGYDELLANFEHQITFDGRPSGPYDVLELDDDDARADGNHHLRTAVDASATSWEIANDDLGIQLIATDSEDGWLWMIDGELVQVTDVTPPTIAFVGVGTADTGSSGSRTPGSPASLANGNLVLIFASTRNSGTGVPQLVTNWDMMWTEGNAAIYGRIKDAGWSAMPTITFSGGAANEDTIAQSMAWSGRFDNIDNVLIRAVGCANASAANIQIPGMPVDRLPENSMVAYGAWKQDDWTSVAAPGSWTEAQEAVSTAGNDAAQVWGYRQFTTRPTPADLAIGSLTVTGGASAISKGVIMVVASDYQIVTVTRGINGVTKAHDAGAIPKLIPASHVAM